MTLSVNSPTRTRPDVSLAPFLLSCVPVLYAAGFSQLRSFGETPLIIALGASLACVLLDGRLIASRYYLVFAAYATVVLGLSFVHVMPPAWTLQHDNAAAIRHWIWVPALPLIATSFYLFLQATHRVIARHSTFIVILLYLATRVLRYYSPDPYTREEALTLYTITSDNALVILAFIYMVFDRPKGLINETLLLVIGLAISSSSQSELYFLLLFAIRYYPIPRHVFIASLVTTTATIVIAPLFIVQIDQFDPNSGIRALLWRDVWLALQQSYGVGVGYGTEYIRNDFYEIRGSHEWSMVGRPEDLIYVGTHSSYYDVALRLGVVGLVLFAAWFFSSIRIVRNVVDTSLQRLYYATALLLVVNSSVNVGLSSIQFLFGSGFCLGMLHFLRVAYLQRRPAQQER